MTYSDAIEKVMIDNGGFASLQHIDRNIEKYRKRTGETAYDTIVGEVQKNGIFTRISRGVWGLTDFIQNIEEDDLGYFFYDEKKEVKFKYKQVTEKIIKSKIRVGQNVFRNSLIREFKKCPITNINDTKLLIASHIKPWAWSNDEERLNPHNGFLLSPLYDRLFDVALITFTTQKKVLISSNLSKENQQRLNINNEQVISNLLVNGREEFIEYHNNFWVLTS